MISSLAPLFKSKVISNFRLKNHNKKIIRDNNKIPKIIPIIFSFFHFLKTLHLLYLYFSYDPPLVRFNKIIAKCQLFIINDNVTTFHIFVILFL